MIAPPFFGLLTGPAAIRPTIGAINSKAGLNGLARPNPHGGTPLDDAQRRPCCSEECATGNSDTLTSEQVRQRC